MPACLTWFPYSYDEVAKARLINFSSYAFKYPTLIVSATCQPSPSGCLNHGCLELPCSVPPLASSAAVGLSSPSAMCLTHAAVYIVCAIKYISRTNKCRLTQRLQSSPVRSEKESKITAILLPDKITRHIVKPTFCSANICRIMP